jgi:hypothetical protein
MYSPSSIVDPTANSYLSHGVMDDVILGNCGMVSNMNSNNANSVDSLLMLNQYSPPHSTSISSHSNNNMYPMQHHHQQQQQQNLHLLNNRQNNQEISYRRVRPEPIR